VDRTGAEIGDTNDVDQWLLRGQLGWDTESGFRGRIIADYSNSTSSCCGAIELFQSPAVTLGAYAAVGLGLNGGNGQPVVATNGFDNTTGEGGNGQKREPYAGFVYHRDQSARLDPGQLA
jgi:hypothetical protein